MTYNIKRKNLLKLFYVILHSYQASRNLQHYEYFQKNKLKIAFNMTS